MLRSILPIILIQLALSIEGHVTCDGNICIFGSTQRGNSCACCTSCEIFHRTTKENVTCAMKVSDCGECLPSYAPIPTFGNKFYDICRRVKSYKNETTHLNLPSASAYVSKETKEGTISPISLGLVPLVVIVVIIIIVVVLQTKKSRRRANRNDNLSEFVCSQSDKQSPYAKKINDSANKNIGKPQGPFKNVGHVPHGGSDTAQFPVECEAPLNPTEQNINEMTLLFSRCQNELNQTGSSATHLKAVTASSSSVKSETKHTSSQSMSTFSIQNDPLGPASVQLKLTGQLHLFVTPSVRDF